MARLFQPSANPGARSIILVKNPIATSTFPLVIAAERTEADGEEDSGGEPADQEQKIVVLATGMEFISDQLALNQMLRTLFEVPEPTKKASDAKV